RPRGDAMHTLLTLLLQIGVVIVTARVVGGLFRKIQQPQVMGEMVAGILLGPSLLGWVAPEAFAFVFPEESLGFLGALSQVGLLVFMFLVGLELNPKLLRGRGHVAVVTSHASIVVPYVLGAVLALYLYDRLSDSRVGFTEFALFMGAAMSVTAFPVLARILTERNLLKTRVGAVTIACAAVDDVTAWCILAGVVALARATSAQELLLFTVGGSIVFVLGMVFVVRPLLGRLEAYYHTRGRMTQDVLAVVLLLMLASAWTTEWIGIHALFGAFLLGAIMPKEAGFVHDLTGKLEDFVVVFLLPLFFAYTGLRTQIGLLNSVDLWLLCGLVTFVAIAGKLGGSALAARLTGLSWREAGALGVLMNTRGLMELVILTIGLELGVISPALFAMMVLMALVTTFMTTPLIEWIYPMRLIQSDSATEEAEDEAFTVLIPVALPSSGPELLRVASTLAPPDRLRVYALHLSRPEAGSVRTESPPDDEALQPLLEAAAKVNAPVRPLSFVSRSPGRDIVEVAHAKSARLVLMGWHKPVLNQSILGGTIYEVMQDARADVAVYLARRYGTWKQVLVPYTGNQHDRGALDLARRIGGRGGLEITILHVIRPDRDAEEQLGLSTAQETLDASGVRLKVVESDDFQEAAVNEARLDYDLVIIGASEEWGLQPTLFSRRHEELARSCPASMLIVRRYVPPSPNSGRLVRPAVKQAEAELTPP
ncbi:MAG TPA: cation:proton antiporter, partial [Rhodothermales bacterium]